MSSNIAKKVSTYAAIAAVGSAAFAGNAHMIVSGIHDVDARGVEITATVDGGTIKTGKRGAGTRLNLSWTDAAGRQQRADGLDISGELAARIILVKALQVETLQIKVIPGETDTKPVIVADMAHRLEVNVSNRMVFGLISLLGALVWGGLAAFGRRKETVEDAQTV